MSFFDLFKRSTQKDPETEKFARAQQAVREFMPILKAKYIAPDKSLHAGTMLSASAWLTGTSLYRSLGFTHADPPGTVIQADQINKEWESLVFMLEGFIFEKTDIPVGRLMMAALAAPDFFKPQVDMLRVQTDLQEQYNVVMQKQGFDYLNGARAGVVLCSAFIQQYDGAKIIDKTASSGIVAQAILEAAKTVPPSLKSS
jgi:hypothetical protein